MDLSICKWGFVIPNKPNTIPDIPKTKEKGRSIADALNKMTKSNVLDKEVIDSMLKEIGNALVKADVNMHYILKLRKNIEQKLDLSEIPEGIDKRKVIRDMVYNELVEMVDCKTPSFQPKRGKLSILMFVGLQGSGKTTTVSKLALYYQNRRFRPAIIAADTFRAGAINQLVENCSKHNITCYYDENEKNPLTICQNGIIDLKKNGNDLILIDTSGKHKHQESLFEEMKQLQSTIQPDNIIFVMDGTMGQSINIQAEAFKKAVNVGSVIITKLDGNAKGGGSISAIAQTQSPIIFIGIGEK